MSDGTAIRVLGIALAFGVCGAVHAQLLDPEAQAFSFQAKFTGVDDGPHELHITLYDAETGGSQVGDPIVITADTQNGIVSEQVPIPDLSVFDGRRLWAELGVDADPPLSPRIPLIAVPYAFRVNRVGSQELDNDITLGDDTADGLLLLRNQHTIDTIAMTAESGSGGSLFRMRDMGGAVRLQLSAHPDADVGVWAVADGPSAQAISGAASSAIGEPVGVRGESTATAGTGVYGVHGAPDGSHPGVRGVTYSTSDNATAVVGEVAPTNPGTYSTAVRGINNGTGNLGIGVWGSHEGSGWGVYGVSSSGRAVYARASAESGENYAVYALTRSPTGYAGFFEGGRNYFQGNVGIGTMMPTRQLEIDGSQAIARMTTRAHTSGSVLELWNQTPDPTHLGAINFLDAAGATVGQVAYRGADDALSFSTNSAERMRIAPDGTVTTFGSTGNRTVYFGGTDAGSLGVCNMTGQASISLWASPFSGGSVSLMDSDNWVQAILEVNPSGSGEMFVYGPNHQANVFLGPAAGDPNNGTVTVLDSTGNSQAGMYVDAGGNGIVWGDVKNFRVPNPDQPGTDIVYACIEGPEAAAYVRGTAHLVNGRATIELPEHFLAVASPTGMTVQVTPLSAESLGLAVVRKSLDGIVVRELRRGTGTYDFDWEVKCVRNGYEDYRVIRPGDELAPANSDSGHEGPQPGRNGN